MRKHGKIALFGFVAALGLSTLAGCSSSSDQAEQISELTVYSGRSEEFIAPFFAEWEKETGITLNIRYGDSAELAAQILEEGANSPADLFLSQDAGSLGAVANAGLFIALPKSVVNDIPTEYVASNRDWVGVTGRSRVFAYAPDAVKNLPTSYEDLIKPEFKGKLGIAPTNSSFQAFVTALIEVKGESSAKRWLQDLQKNDVKIYSKNSVIVEAIDNGEISIGLVNHYYVWEVSQALGREINVKIAFFSPGDLGNLINVSGAGIMKSSKKQSAAEQLINYLTSRKTQEEFVNKTHEYSLLEGVIAPDQLPALKEIGAPTVDLDSLDNVKGTQDLLIEVGLL